MSYINEFRTRFKTGPAPQRVSGAAFDMAKQKSKKEVSPAQRKVWRIFHFESRYEMPEDMKSNRKSGLNYTKRFVGTNGGDEAVGYQLQLGMLCNGDGQESCLLEGLYGKLVNMAAALSRAKRGYLIDADDKPLSSAQIAKLLNIAPPTMRKMIARFEKVRLLERVELPEFDLSKNEPPVKNGAEKGKGGGFRKFPEKSGKKRKALKKKPNINNNPNNNSNKTGLNGKDIENKTLTGFNKETGTCPEHRQAQNPSSPKVSEAGAVRPQYVPKQPLSARCRPSQEPERIGHIISGYFPEHWRDPECQQFAWEMVEALGMPLDDKDAGIRSEAGAFASWLFKLKSVASGAIIEELKQKAFEKAAFVISPKGKSYINKRAGWTNLMKKVLASRGIILPVTRAGPKAVSV